MRIFTPVLEFVAWMLVGYIIIGILFVLFLALYRLVARPAASIGQVNRAAQSEQPVRELRRVLNTAPDTPDIEVWRQGMDRSRQTALRQQGMISLLLIALALGFLICFFANRTAATLGQAVWRISTQGGASVVLWVMLFYSAKHFFGMDDILASPDRFIKGFGYAGIYGVASVVTMVFLPPFLGESVLSGSAIAVGLVLNVIVDTVISFYDALINLLWKSPRQVVADWWRNRRGQQAA